MNFSHHGRGGGVVNLVTTKVINQDMFFFTLSYILDNNLWNEKKKDMIVSPWKSREMAKC